MDTANQRIAHKYPMAGIEIRDLYPFLASCFCLKQQKKKQTFNKDTDRTAGEDEKRMSQYMVD